MWDAAWNRRNGGGGWVVLSRTQVENRFLRAAGPENDGCSYVRKRYLLCMFQVSVDGGASAAAVAALVLQAAHGVACCAHHGVLFRNESTLVGASQPVKHTPVFFCYRRRMFSRLHPLPCIPAMAYVLFVVLLSKVYLLSFAKEDALTQWMRKLNTAMIIGGVDASWPLPC